MMAVSLSPTHEAERPTGGARLLVGASEGGQMP